MKLERILLKTAVVLMLLMYVHVTHAGCTVYRYGSRTANFGSKSFVVAKNQTPGTIIGESITLSGTGPNSSLYTSINCQNRSFFFYQRYSSFMQEAKDYPGIYKTNVDGIGFKLKTSNSIFVGNNMNKWNQWYNAHGCINCDLNATSSTYILEFYVIGPVKTGTVVLNGRYVTGYGDDRDSGSGQTLGYFSIIGSAEFKSASCTTPNITVNLNNHAASDFASVGATSAPVPFNFEINNCDPGLTSVSYTFQPASGVTLQGSGNNQYLTLDSSSTASGVGVQVLYEDGVTAVPFNEKTTFSGYVKATGGSYTIPMKARYVRTGTISPGSANSAAEFVMAYE